MVAVDLLMVVLSYYGAFWIRMEGALPPYMADMCGKTIPIVVVLKLAFFYYFNLH